MTRQLVNESAERAVLGSILSDPSLLISFDDVFTPEIFSLPRHRDIVTAILELHRQGRDIAIAAVVGKLPESDGEFSQAGYLATLAGDQADMALAHDLMDDLREIHAMRVLQETGKGLIDDVAKDSSESADEIANKAIAILQRGIAPQSRSVVTIKQAVDSAIVLATKRREGREPAGLPWFMPGLTSIMGPIERGSVVGLLADSKGGKTSLALQQITHAARFGRVLFFSIEMDMEEVGFRQLAQFADVDETRIAEGRYTDAEWDRLVKARDELERLPIEIDYRYGPTVARMRSQAMRSRQKGELSLIVIDHLKLIQPQDRRLRAKIEKYEEIMPDVKALAKDLKTPVLLLMQRLRGALDRPNPRPHDQDAYGGGATLENLNSLLGIWREDIWLRKHPPHPNASHEAISNHDAKVERHAGRAQLISLARRRGKSDQAMDCKFDGATARFREISADINQERLAI